MKVLVTSREGINQTAKDMQKLDNLISLCKVNEAIRDNKHLIHFGI